MDTEKLDLHQFSARTTCPICDADAPKTLGQLPTIHPRSRLDVTILACRSCGHWFTTPSPSQEHLATLYGSGSLSVLGAGWAASLSTQLSARQGAAPAPLLSRLNHWIAKEERHNGPESYLEFGPGDCSLLQSFQTSGWNAWGVELGAWAQGQLQVVHATAELPPGLKYTVIVVHDVLEHVADPADFLRTLTQLLSPGGRLYLAFPNADSIDARLFKTRWAMVRPLGHLHYFSRRSLSLLLRQTGCEVGYAGRTYAGIGPYTIRKSLERARHGAGLLRALSTAGRVLVQRTLNALGHGDQWRIRAVKVRTPT